MAPHLGFGLGLRPPHYQDALAGTPRVDWWEVISENFMVAGGNPRRVLRLVRERWPVVLHGVSLSIGSVDPLDERYLARLRELVAEVEPAIVSDHLCWSRFGGHAAHDLWPLPYTEEALAHVVARVAHVQDRLGRRILLENPSSYITFAASELGEAEFLAEVARRADCGILLDVNNVYVSCANHGWSAEAYLAAIPHERVGQIHLAGHSDHGTHLLDTHDQPVCDAVWSLYARAVERFGVVSTMIERDDQIPPLAEMIAELDRARSRRQPRSVRVRDLATIQRAFYELVTAGEGAIAPGLLGTSRRLDVYADMYGSRLHDVLADDYPKLRAALGDAAFHELVASYLRAHPPQSFTVRDAGLALPAEVAGHDELPPWSRDLATLERARVEVFDAGDAAVLTREVVAAVPPESFPAVALTLVPASVVVPLGWTVDELWSAIEDDTVRGVPVPCGRTVLVWRRELRVVHRTLDDDEAVLVARLVRGTTLGEVSADLVDLGTPDPEHRMVELLSRWLDAELLANPFAPRWL